MVDVDVLYLMGRRLQSLCLDSSAGGTGVGMSGYLDISGTGMHIAMYCTLLTEEQNYSPQHARHVMILSKRKP